MTPINLDMDVLRSFLTGIELGSFAKAAERLGRSASAVSLQLRKLEEQVGQPLVRKKGRGLALTEAGEIMVGYARRIIDLNDEARMALGGLASLEGWVRVGVPQDFAETWLPGLLARFGSAHPKARIEARVEGGSAMAKAVEAGHLDLALTWGHMGSTKARIVGKRQVVWISSPTFRWSRSDPLPLIFLEAPCAFRQAATQSLDEAGIAWRPAFATTSLTGVWAAVAAGLGVTARIAQPFPLGLREIPADDFKLPKLAAIELALHRDGTSKSPACDALAGLLVEEAGTRR